MMSRTNMLSAILWIVTCVFAAKVAHGQVEPKIVGGEDAQPGQFPWQASFQWLWNGTFHHICGALIIDRKHVLSAAHCLRLDDDPKHYRVVVGAHDINKTSEPTRQIFDVCRMRHHPNYEIANTNYSDVSIITLSKPIKFNDRVKPVRLPEPDKPAPTGEVCTLSGWGVRWVL